MSVSFMLFIILLVIAVVGAVVLFVTCPRMRRLMLMAMSAVFVSVFVVMLVIALSRMGAGRGHMQPEPMRRVTKPQAPVEPHMTHGHDSSSATPGSAWLAAADEEFEADIYPSIESAGAALGRKLVKLISPLLSVDDKKTIIQLTSFPTGERDQFSVEVGKVLRSKLNDVEVLRVEAGDITPLSQSDSSQTHALIVRLQWRNWGTVTLPQASLPAAVQHTGTVIANAEGPTGSAECQTKYIGKPWVEHFDQFVSQDSSRQWLLARSSQFSTDAQDAHLQALDQAVASVARLVNGRLAQSPGTNRRLRGAGDLESGPNGLSTQIWQQGLIADEFTQQFRRPYGNVWRSAVLVDVSPDKIEALARHIANVHQVHRRHTLSTAASIAGLVAVICLLYWFLNAATKGYYVGSLRMTMLLVGSVGVLVLLFVA